MSNAIWALDQLARVSGIKEVFARSATEVDLHVEVVKEPGRNAKAIIGAQPVYFKDAAQAAYTALNFSACSGGEIVAASQMLVGRLFEEAPDLGNDEPTVTDIGGIQLGFQIEMIGPDYGMQPPALRQLMAESRRLLTRYLGGYDLELEPLLETMCRRWRAYYHVVPEKFGPEELLKAFLLRDRERAKRWIRWFADQPYGATGPSAFVWHQPSNTWAWVFSGGPTMRVYDFMADLPEPLRPLVLILRIRSSVIKTERPSTPGFDRLAELLEKEALADIETFIRGMQTMAELFPPDEIGGTRWTKEHGSYLGLHFTSWVYAAKRLRQLGYDIAAEVLLLGLVDACEQEQRIEGMGVPPWYYDQLRIIYKKRRDFESMYRIMKRCHDQRWGGRPPDSDLDLGMYESELEELQAAAKAAGVQL